MDDENRNDKPVTNESDEQRAEGTSEAPPATKAAATFALTPEQIAFAKAQAEKTFDASKKAATAAGDESEEEDPDAGEAFPVYPPVEGEMLVPASRLGISRHHPRRGSRRASDHASALALSAIEPMALRPIVVVKDDDGAYAVIDGRFRLEAIKGANRGNQDIMVRCVLFDGTEAEAVAHLCDEGLGSVGMTAIEQSRALFSLQQTSNVSQTEIARRYPRLTITKVNNMLRAARTWDQWPELFDILLDPDRAPVDYGVRLFTLMKKLDPEEQATLLDRARDLVANGERFTSGEALKALQVDTMDEPGHDLAGTDPIEEEPVPDVEDVFGADDQPLGTAEQLDDDRLRLTLPSAGEIEAMSVSEREENAAPFIVRIRQHFGLQEG